MTVLHAGGKFDKQTYQVSGGLHGVGVSCVNALSNELIAEVHRDGKIHKQSYSKGIPTSEVEVIGDTDITGTFVTFLPDDTIFEELICSFETLSKRLRELSYLNKGLHLSLEDKRNLDENGDPLLEEYFSEGGLLNLLSTSMNFQVVMYWLSHLFMYQVSKISVVVEVAFQYNRSYRETLRSYVNNINTVEGTMGMDFAELSLMF